MLKHILTAVLLTAFLSACTTNRIQRGEALSSISSQNSVTADDVPAALNLTDYLERVSGVNIIGRGGGAQVRIRGPQSFMSGQGPLFVIDGSILGYDYGTVYNSVNVREISRVRVLKDASETARYGARGATGVIEIYLRDT